MTRALGYRLLGCALLGANGWSVPATAHSVFDATLRTGPQFVQYRLARPVNETISELTIPFFVVVPISPTVTVDVGTAYAWARVEPNGGVAGETSTLSGLTDTQVRANLTLGSDFVVLTAGLNLPTGRSTASPSEQLAAFRLGSDFLSFPISNFGTGFGLTGGIAVAKPFGAWNVGVGGSVRHSSSYEPFEDGGGARPRFQPGDEYRVRAGVDRPYGTGRIAVAATLSKFGDDDIAGSIYNTGDRYIVQAGFTNSFAGSDVVVNAWNLYRTAGTILTGDRLGPENITNLLVGVGVRAFTGVVEPTLELRNWHQERASASRLGTLAVRYSVEAGGVAVTPSVGYTVGRLSTAGPAATINGFRGALAIRLGP